MRIVKLLLPICMASLVSAQPVITPANFLNTLEPPRMCQNYLDFEFAPGTEIALRKQMGFGYRDYADIQKREGLGLGGVVQRAIPPSGRLFAG